MLNWIVRNSWDGSFNRMNLKTCFTNIFNVYVKIGFGIKQTIMVDMP